MSDAPASTASSLDQTADGRLAVVSTWLDDERRMAHEAEDADRRWRDTVEENRRIRDQLGTAQREASAWRRAAEDASLRCSTLEVRADEADRFALRCGQLLEQAADGDGAREEELRRARDDARDALDRAAKAEEERRVLGRRAQLLTAKVAEADATSALLRERLRRAKESYEESLAQAARDIDMRTEELNSIQDRLDEVAAEKARIERQASR
ncbi:hypothetical protein KVR01_007466 [Diaporthe batatas]|uniref:uncharacterized protein n=1 Tax=Diaporthe batatas TaxID=748121 RepID=UPI001D046948|nr:uncharacterized protein KVR01_007466 [Diaporthe batatas]KAG8162988.1 hypothetical protein KVR01_007466 [Diaporthe batatas]